jgi:hypothetical protein
MKVALYLVPSVASDVLIVVCERTDQYCASAAPILVCLSTIVRLPPRFVSRNVSGKPPFIAVPSDHYCEPLRLQQHPCVDAGYG